MELEYSVEHFFKKNVIIPRGFVASGLISKMTARDKDIYFFLSSKVNKYRFTRMTNKYITEKTGIPNITINRSLKRLEFYHFIQRWRHIPKARRIITLLRWDSAQALLSEEKKHGDLDTEKITKILRGIRKQEEEKIKGGFFKNERTKNS